MFEQIFYVVLKKGRRKKTGCLTYPFSKQIHTDGQRESRESCCSQDRCQALCTNRSDEKTEKPVVFSVLLDIL